MRRVITRAALTVLFLATAAPFASEATPAAQAAPVGAYGARNTKLWYCEVSYIDSGSGKRVTGTLGGYNSRDEAVRRYNNWARSATKPNLINIYSK